MPAADELIVLQHRLTEQTMLVPVSAYIAGAKVKYQNFRLRGTGKFIAPPCLTLLKASNDPLAREAAASSKRASLPTKDCHDS